MNRFKMLGVTLGLIGVASVLAACGEGVQGGGAGYGAPGQSATAGAPSSVVKAADQVAAALAVPAGHTLTSTYDATGVQVYTCLDSAWKPLEPAATLTDKEGRTIGLHSRGPVWISTLDGSAVAAGPVAGASNARPNAVPELLLKSTATRGEGVFGKVSYVQRLRTEGGVSPTGTCVTGAQQPVKYTAVYTFHSPTGGTAQ
ncbi:DUF3455 domain-containing protein [Crossiella cryophila]|uniref:DUF3455 domain-containing protein n=1 Tax=Crossiella cryophila TaxID=43355 RepID=A0A7W7CII7_9PSEU|nr:DUF3455 domain-containing protein [Crossiella cryophila]MBB4681865.1 hypothetical protein [Crossiella cryophila]